MSGSSPTFVFKRCPVCGDLWRRPSDLLSDPLVAFIGYEPSGELDPHGFLFKHGRCGASFPVLLEDSAAFTLGLIVADQDEVRGAEGNFCFAKRANRTCPPHCPCAYVRHIASLVDTWPKRARVDHGPGGNGRKFAAVNHDEPPAGGMPSGS